MSRLGAFARLDRLDRAAGFAPLALRLFLGVFLVYMSQDNVLSAARMREFEGFLASHGFPEPRLLAPLSVHAQLACGVLVLAGALTRWAALVMVVHFVVAIAGVHVGLPFRTYLEPCAMLAASLALFIGGPGRWSVDRLLRGQAHRG